VGGDAAFDAAGDAAVIDAHPGVLPTTDNGSTLRANDEDKPLVRYHERFEWDVTKAKRNLAEHGVALEEAELVLGQDDAENYLLEFYDDEHSTDEDRYCTIGSLPEDRNIVLRITWTERADDLGTVSRIISVRTASRRQRSEYAKEIRRRLRQ